MRPLWPAPPLAIRSLMSPLSPYTFSGDTAAQVVARNVAARAKSFMGGAIAMCWLCCGGF